MTEVQDLAEDLMHTADPDAPQLPHFTVSSLTTGDVTKTFNIQKDHVYDWSLQPGEQCPVPDCLSESYPAVSIVR